MTGDVVHLHPVHPIRPEIAGKIFDECYGLSSDAINLLASRGLVFLTEFTWFGKVYGARIIARDWEHAEQIVAERPYREKLTGQLVELFHA